MKKIIILLTVLGWNLSSVFATHIAGGDISYVHLGGDSFLVTLKVYRDCSGFQQSTTSQNITFESSCANFSVDLPFLDSTEISQLCGAEASNSYCNNGILPGMQEYVYQDIVVLTPCADWNIYYLTGDRNASTNIPGSGIELYYANATLNNISAPTNSSVVFTAQPIPYVCLNQAISYNWGIVETNGDSLVFELVCPQTGPGSPLGPYSSPYSCTNPINGITIDSETGQIDFTPTTIGNFIVVVQVTEYNDSGQVIGTAIRDIQFIAQICSNELPDDTGGVVQNLMSPANLLGPYEIELCEGDTLSFDATYSDSDLSDILTITSNINFVLPGASYSTSGTNPLTVHYEWLVPAGTAGTNTAFSVTVNDGACPIPGLQFFVYDIVIREATIAGPDVTICGPHTALPGQANISVTGGTSFQWTSISGAPLVVGTNFSCDTCSSIIATPNVTTTYVVTSDLSSSCKNSDTVTVFVVPDFTFSTTESDDSICLQDQVLFNTTPNPNVAGYIYGWSSTGCTFDDDSIHNPTGTFNTADSIAVFLHITSPDGCLKKDTFWVNVSANVIPDIVVEGDSTMCEGDSALLVAVNTNGLGCTFIIEMFDSWPDGWNGGYIEFLVNDSVTSTHTVPYPDADNTDTVTVNYGNIISINCFGGSYPIEGSFNIYDGSGNLLFAAPYLEDHAQMWIDTFTCMSSGLDVTWIPNMGTDTLFGDSVWVSPTSDITYTLTAVDPIGGCSDTTQFTVHVVPNFNIVATASDDSICRGDQVQYNVTADSAFAFEYHWFPDGLMNDSSIANPIGTHDNPGLNDVLVAVTNEFGCTRYDHVSVLVSNNYTPDLTILGNDTICEGENTYLFASDASNDNCFIVLQMTDLLQDSWNGAYLEVMENGNLQGTYTMLGLDINPTIDTIYVSSGSTISINFISGFFDDEVTYFIYDNSGNLLFSDGLTVDLSPPTAGNNIWSSVITCADSNMNFTWSPNYGLSSTTGQGVWATPLTDTTYTVVAVDPIGGCTDNASFTVHVIHGIVADITTTDTIYCLSDATQTLQGIPAGGTWAGNLISPSGQFQPSDLGLGPEIYVYNYFNGGCWSDDSITVYVFAPPLPPIPSANNPYCAGHRLTDITVITNNGEVHWYSNPGLTTEVNPLTMGASNMTLWVTETDSLGCVSDPASLNIQTTYTPYVDFSFDNYDSSLVEAPTNINFTNQSAPSSAHYTWYVDGVMVADNAYNYTYTFAEGGTYAVTLVGVNPTSGCLDSLTRHVFVYELKVEIPTVISPNGDGMNDKFYIKSKGLQDITMTIYNRWGNVVYGPCGPADDANICVWDGDNQPSGTYYYMVSAKDRDGKKIKRDDLNGFITVIRD